MIKICDSFTCILHAGPAGPSTSSIFIVFNRPEDKEDDLDATDDGESSEKSHGASNETQLGLGFDLLVSLDVVKGCRVKANFYKLKSRLRHLVP